MQKDVRKTIRFSQSEFEIIKKELEKSNITFTEFARSAILRKKIKLPIEKHFLFELNKIGNNLNQIARTVNTNNRVQIISKLVDIENQLKDLR